MESRHPEPAEYKFFAEVSPEVAGKEKLARRYLEKIDIELGNALTIGNGNNDREMICDF